MGTGNKTRILWLVILWLVGLVMTVLWFFSFFAIFNGVHDGYPLSKNTREIVFGDGWFWMSFLIATAVSWLVLIIVYLVIRKKRRKASYEYAAEYAALKKYIAGDAGLSETYEKMKGMSDNYLERLVVEGVKNKEAYCKSLYDTHEGLVVISVFMNDPPDVHGIMRNASKNATGFGVIPDRPVCELDEFKFDFDDE